MSIADFCYESLRKMGKDVTLKKDLELKPEDINGQDILMSLGKSQVMKSKVECSSICFTFYRA